MSKETPKAPEQDEAQKDTRSRLQEILTSENPDDLALLNQYLPQVEPLLSELSKINTDFIPEAKALSEKEKEFLGDTLYDEKIEVAASLQSAINDLIIHAGDIDAESLKNISASAKKLAALYEQLSAIAKPFWEKLNRSLVSSSVFQENKKDYSDELVEIKKELEGEDGLGKDLSARLAMQRRRQEELLEALKNRNADPDDLVGYDTLADLATTLFDEQCYILFQEDGHNRTELNNLKDLDVTKYTSYLLKALLVSRRFLEGQKFIENPKG